MRTNLPLEYLLPNTTSNIQFEDLFEVEKIQQMQDLFAETHGVASIITDPTGIPITKPSNFTRLCSEIIRKTEKGCANCYKSDALIVQNSADGPFIQKCLSGGLWDAGVGITVAGKHLGNWLIGQVQNKDINKEELLPYADKIGANREDFTKALDEVPSMSLNQFRKIAKLLHVYASELSEKAWINLQLRQQSAEREEIIAQLKESESRYRLIAENIFDSIAVLDLNLNFIFLSPSVFNLLGYTSQEMLTLKLEDISPSESLEKLQQTLSEEIALENSGISDPNRKRVIESQMICKD